MGFFSVIHEKEVKMKREYFWLKTPQKASSNQRCPATKNQSILFAAKIWIHRLYWAGKAAFQQLKFYCTFGKRVSVAQGYSQLLSSLTQKAQLHNGAAARKNCRGKKSIHQDSRKTHFIQQIAPFASLLSNDEALLWGYIQVTRAPTRSVGGTCQTVSESMGEIIIEQTHL